MGLPLGYFPIEINLRTQAIPAKAAVIRTTLDPASGTVPGPVGPAIVATVVTPSTSVVRRTKVDFFFMLCSVVFYQVGLT